MSLHEGYRRSPAALWFWNFRSVAFPARLADDADGDEMIVAAIFSYRRTSIITKRALEQDLATKARHLMKRAAVGLDSPP